MNKLTCAEARQISLVGLLAALGYEPDIVFLFTGIGSGSMVSLRLFLRVKKKKSGQQNRGSYTISHIKLQ